VPYRVFRDKHVYGQEVLDTQVHFHPLHQQPKL